LPASQKQLDTLSKIGIQFDHGISKGDAAQLLDKRLNDPATDKQLFWLEKHSIKFDHNLTKMEACKLISNLK